MYLIGISYDFIIQGLQNYAVILTVKMKCPISFRVLKMPSYCSVAICKSPKDATYFKFPSDPKLCKSWVVACRRKNVFNTKHSRVCEKHFLPSDFVRDLQHELLNLPLRKAIKKGAIPSANLRSNEADPALNSERSHRATRREQKQTVKELLTKCKHEMTAVYFFLIVLNLCCLTIS